MIELFYINSKLLTFFVLQLDCTTFESIAMLVHDFNNNQEFCCS